MKLSLTARQIRRLQSGQGIRVEAHQVGSGPDIPLSAIQERKLSKACVRGKGFNLKAEPHQLKGGNPFLSILAGLIPTAGEGVIKLFKGNGVAATTVTTPPPGSYVERAGGPKLRKPPGARISARRYLQAQEDKAVAGSGLRLPGGGITLPGRGLFIPGLSIDAQIKKK